MATETQSQVEKQELPGDQYVNKYIKTAKALYAYQSDINSIEMFKATKDLQEGGEFELGGYFWQKKGSILFRKTKEEHDAWKARGGKFDTRKITELLIMPLDVAGMQLASINMKLSQGYELFGKDFRSSVIEIPDRTLPDERARTLIVGMVKKQ